MSYARFSEGDVYVFGDARGGITCCACWLRPSSRPENLIGAEDFNCQTLPEMLAHLKEHEAAGHDADEAISEMLYRHPELRETTHTLGEQQP